MLMSDAIKMVMNVLKEDMDYRRAWHANISMAFQDEYNRRRISDSAFIKEVADTAADHFINLFCEADHDTKTDYGPAPESEEK